jgi:serine phosphatase RsbU (regulator of sigma subunit)
MKIYKVEKIGLFLILFGILMIIFFILLNIFSENFVDVYAVIILLGIASVLLGISLRFFNKSHEKRTRIVRTFNIICFSVYTVGVIFKYLHFPGSGIMIVIGSFILAFSSGPLVFINKFEKWKYYARSSKNALFLSLSDMLGKAGLITGLLFKIMHWPGASILLIVGGVLFLISYFIWSIEFQKEVVLRKEAEDSLSKSLVEIKNQKNEIEEKNEELNQLVEEVSAQRDEIESQRDHVLKQKEIIEEIHEEISESINYATRLQQSILPDEEILNNYVSDFFVLFKPKDKVSGDFYWWAHVENQTIIVAADCTGHGVPGAFMSMLGGSMLREIVQKEYITHTGVILRKLRKEIIKSLKQKGNVGEQKDGMDMAIISINHETNLVQFSGANNPLYIISNERLKDLEPPEGLDNFYEIKPDKMPIAIYEKMDNFTNHEIQLAKGDQLFMFSDGYADQFGGEKGKKFKYKPFKKLLSENRDKSMMEQKDILDKTFEDWKGDLEQIDDVVVLGVKI